MREFLTDYAQMIAENHESEITKDELNRIVEILMEDDEIWNLVDSKITDMLDNKEVI